MSELLTISEFAKLRNININSLRYYERLGIFKPCKIDEANGYRYYAVDQLAELDFVLLCIDLGVPIKELPEFVGEDGHLRIRRLMEHGHEHLLAKLNEYRGKLSRVEKALEYIDVNRAYARQNGVYTKHIAERAILTEPAPQSGLRSSGMERTIAAIYKKAAEAKLFPLYPVGLLISGRGEEMSLSLFTSYIGDGSGARDVLALPAGDYLCAQVDVAPDMDILAEVEKFRGESDRDVIVENIFYDEYSASYSRSELQIII